MDELKSFFNLLGVAQGKGLIGEFLASLMIGFTCHIKY